MPGIPNGVRGPVRSERSHGRPRLRIPGPDRPAPARGEEVLSVGTELDFARVEGDSRQVGDLGAPRGADVPDDGGGDAGVPGHDPGAVG